MSVKRIGTTIAKEDKIDELRDFLKEVVAVILDSDGAIACELLQNEEDPREFIIIEEWESTDHHQASVKNIPDDMMGRFRPLVAEAPGGGYYKTLRR